jgi:UDP-N-acetyl-D-mannosaminouronate:lipid I N-acetyl-D-mannosaminouronosyltransferase
MVERLRDQQGLLIALNAEKVANADEELKSIVNQNIGYADGAGVVLALRRKGVHSARIAGSDLWLDLVRDATPGRSVYLVGSTRTVIEATVERLARTIPGVRIAGYRDGFLTDGDAELLADDLRRTQPDLVLVAMGSPRQERLMATLRRAWPALYMGLGGSFDVFAGQKPRAPRWIQRSGLEWAYQFVRSPRRLRRLPAYVKFAALLSVGRL